MSASESLKRLAEKCEKLGVVSASGYRASKAQHEWWHAAQGKRRPGTSDHYSPPPVLHASTYAALSRSEKAMTEYMAARMEILSARMVLLGRIAASVNFTAWTGGAQNDPRPYLIPRVAMVSVREMKWRGVE